MELNDHYDQKGKKPKEIILSVRRGAVVVSEINNVLIKGEHQCYGGSSVAQLARDHILATTKDLGSIPRLMYVLQRTITPVASVVWRLRFKQASHFQISGRISVHNIIIYYLSELRI